ncbi:hypothetical protein FACS1894125_0190 [Actinomycetota bacterium]|nr:hypothetical protein FACS1894125_0190 [Actinomycetota bacterium]
MNEEVTQPTVETKEIVKEIRKSKTASGKSVIALRIGRVISTVVLILAIGVGALILTTQSDTWEMFGWKSYVVLSGSMSPDIPVDSLIFTQKTEPANVHVGDVITFTADKDNRVVTHKVVNVLPNYQGSGAPAFRTKGIANPNPDKDPVPAANVRGVVKLHVDDVGFYLNYLAGNVLIVFVIYALLVAALTLFTKASKDKRKAAAIAAHRQNQVAEEKRMSEENQKMMLMMQAMNMQQQAVAPFVAPVQAVPVATPVVSPSVVAAQTDVPVAQFVPAVASVPAPQSTAEELQKQIEILQLQQQLAALQAQQPVPAQPAQQVQVDPAINAGKVSTSAGAVSAEPALQAQQAQPEGVVDGV